MHESLQSWSVGEVTITKIHEVTLPTPVTAFFRDADVDALGEHAWWATPDFVDAAGNLLLSVHALVVESQGVRIVVDTCVGNDRALPFPGWGDVASDFLEDLGAAGFAPGTVDLVVCTHLHFDHVGWNTRLVDGRWVPTFPNARYLFGRVEYEHWCATLDEPASVAASVTFDDAVRPVIDAGLADLVESTHVLTPEVRLVPSPGHSPGHHCVVIESAGARAVITGDCVHSPLQFAHPGWRSVADADHDTAVRTRERLRDAWVHDDVLVIGTHFAGPTAGRVRHDHRGWSFDATR